MTSWGMRIDREIIGGLEQCVVIGVGSVGVDMVDVDAATAAGIVVTNVPDVFIEEVADHAMMLLLDVARMTRADVPHGARGRVVPGAPHPQSSARDCSVRPSGLFRLRQRRALHGHAGPRPSACACIAYDPYVSELEITARRRGAGGLQRAAGAQRLPVASTPRTTPRPSTPSTPPPSAG